MNGFTMGGLAKMRTARGRAITPDPVFAASWTGVTGRWRKRSRAAVLLVPLLFLALALPASADRAVAQSRSERIGQVRIDAELAPDGSMRVVEEREFVYSGSFEGAFYELQALRNGQQVTLNQITDEQGNPYRPGECSPDGTRNPGQYELDNDDGFRVTWCWDPPPTDTSRTITLDYTVTNAGVRHEDSSELYYQFVGTGWDVPTASVVADVRLPTEEVQFWAHGPLTGTVDEVEPRLIRMQVNDLPSSTFVELRALMPAAALAQAQSDGESVRQAILDEEACLATAANAERARARGEQPTEDCDPNAGRKLALTAALGVLLVIGAVGWVVMFLRHGREYPLPEMPDYEHDLPEKVPPALVDYLLNWGTVTDKALVATILDLARQRHITLRREIEIEDRLLLPDREHAVTVFERGNSLPERSWERDVFSLLFDDAAHGGDRVTDRELKAWVESHRQSAYDWWQSWKSAVAWDTKGRRWIEPQGWIAASIAVGVLLLGAAIGAGVLGANLILVVITALAGIGALAASPLMRRRTMEGRVLEHRWRRFGAYLTDYSLIPERGPEYLALWGTWLVYAVPLGVADTVMKNLNAKLSEAELQQVGGGWYPMYVGGHYYGFGEGLSVISDAIPTSAIATSPASSAGGGGGGFSGGGGGGGGGSGGGSF
jgi:uncharacterized membrane protein